MAVAGRWAFWTSGRYVVSGARAVLVRRRDGVEFVVRLEPAPRDETFYATPARWLATVRRDRSWWITVGRSDVAWSVLRERALTASDGWARLQELQAGLTNGTLDPGLWPQPFRRWIPEGA